MSRDSAALNTTDSRDLTAPHELFMARLSAVTICELNSSWANKFPLQGVIGARAA